MVENYDNRNISYTCQKSHAAKDRYLKFSPNSQTFFILSKKKNGLSL